MHLNDGQLRAHLDGQLSADSTRHLDACQTCQARLATLQAQTQRVAHSLSALSAAESASSVPGARAALARFNSHSAERKDTFMVSQLFRPRLRPLWGTVTLVAALAVALSIEPVRVWAGQFLGLFRVQQITVLPIDTTGLSALAGDETLGPQIGRLVSQSLTVTHEPGEPQVVADAAEASARAGFNVRLLSEREASQITVQDGAAFEFVVDRAQAQALLDEAGRSDLQLPASLEGVTIRVEIPTGVSTAYGDCQGLDEPETEFGQPRWQRLQNCVLLAQMPSPSVTAPPDLDVGQLAEIGLQFTGMSPEEAHRFSQTVDWTSTLVVPIPRNGHDYEQVAVDGVTGNLIYRVADDGVPARYMVLWIKDGIVYALSGFGGPQQAVSLANSLR
jgi:hypothetical protein